MRDLLLEFYLLSSSVGVSDDSLAVVAPSLPLWLLFIIIANSAGVVLKVACTVGGLSFVGGIKWYGCRVLYTAFTLLNSTFRTGHRLFYALYAPLYIAYFFIADLSTLVG